MRSLFQIMLLMLLLAGCATIIPQNALTLPTQPIPTATPDVYQLALGNIQAQATLEAMRSTSQAISANLTSTAYAPTQQAIETATERAWTMTGWTATAAVQQTATAASGTATAQSWTPTPDFTATVESAAASAYATAMHGEAVSVELAIERERMMNKVQAVAPPRCSARQTGGWRALHRPAGAVGLGNLPAPGRPGKYRLREKYFPAIPGLSGHPGRNAGAALGH